jgi:hypothetical protein
LANSATEPNVRLQSSHMHCVAWLGDSIGDAMTKNEASHLISMLTLTRSVKRLSHHAQVEKVLFFGTDDFAATHLDRLIQERGKVYGNKVVENLAEGFDRERKSKSRSH